MPAPDARILLVDDDVVLSGVLTDYLEAAGFRVRTAHSGPDALEAVADQAPDLILLDLSLPGLDGLEVFRRLRHDGRSMPVIMLTARAEEPERILGLEVGADDYVTKPCSPREVVLRVRSVLRRSAATMQPQDQQVLIDGDLQMDRRAGTVTRRGAPLELAPREYALLERFLSAPGTLLDREEILRSVWHWEHGDPSTVTVHVRRLREKIEVDPAHPVRLVTVWGRGYRWEPAQ